MIGRLSECPTVFEVWEELKKATGFRHHSRSTDGPLGLAPSMGAASIKPDGGLVPEGRMRIAQRFNVGNPATDVR
jgi:hypothetical protein